VPEIHYDFAKLIFQGDGESPHFHLEVREHLNNATAMNGTWYRGWYLVLLAYQVTRPDVVPRMIFSAPGLPGHETWRGTEDDTSCSWPTRSRDLTWYRGWYLVLQAYQVTRPDVVPRMILGAPGLPGHETWRCVKDAVFVQPPLLADVADRDGGSLQL